MLFSSSQRGRGGSTAPSTGGGDLLAGRAIAPRAAPAARAAAPRSKGAPVGAGAPASGGDDLLAGGGGAGGGGGGGGEGGVAEDDLLGGAKRARKVRLTFKESHLISDQGLWRLYEQMQLLPLSRRKGDEVRGSAPLPARRTTIRECTRSRVFPRLNPPPAPQTPTRARRPAPRRRRTWQR